VAAAVWAANHGTGENEWLVACVFPRFPARRRTHWRNYGPKWSALCGLRFPIGDLRRSRFVVAGAWAVIHAIGEN
jgi:hypothetical protein